MSYKAILLDRDGVINHERGHVLNVSDFEMLPGVGKAIAELNRRGIKVALVTNQSGLARGLLTQAQLRTIHQEMNRQLALEGASLDEIFISPWHPDITLKGGVKKWLGEHEDRKPGVGMLSKALERFGVASSEAAMVGDSAKDRDAARLIGIDFFGVRSSKSGEIADEDRLFDDLEEVVEFLISQGHV